MIMLPGDSPGSIFKIAYFINKAAVLPRPI